MSSKQNAETWNALFQKPEATRSAVEQIIVDINCLLMDIESGGWLYNISPAAGEGNRWSRLRQVSDSAAAMGATDLAARLQEVVAIVESADVQRAGVWQDFIRQADPDNRLNGIEAAMNHEIPKSWELLETYTTRYLSETR
jgi:hypothetical protein